MDSTTAKTKAQAANGEVGLALLTDDLDDSSHPASCFYCIPFDGDALDAIDSIDDTIGPAFRITWIADESLTRIA